MLNPNEKRKLILKGHLHAAISKCFNQRNCTARRNLILLASVIHEEKSFWRKMSLADRLKADSKVLLAGQKLLYRGLLFPAF